MLKVKFVFFLFLLATYFLRPHSDVFAKVNDRVIFLQSGVDASAMPLILGLLAIAAIGFLLAFYEQKILQFFKRSHLQFH